jgi:hypothetical protein
MKIKRSTPRKLKVLYAVIIVLILAGIGYGIYQVATSRSTTNDNPSNVNKVNSSPPTDEQVQAGTEAKRQTVENNEITKPDGTDGKTSQQIAATITSANQNGSSVTIRTLITGSVSSSTSCSLTVTNDATSITKTAAAQSLASSATCQGFDIPVSELGAGMWSIQLTVTSGTQSTAASTSLIVK